MFELKPTGEVMSSDQASQVGRDQAGPTEEARTPATTRGAVTGGRVWQWYESGPRRQHDPPAALGWSRGFADGE